jgi:membrane fusion protein (multidrug efflux system)
MNKHFIIGLIVVILTITGIYIYYQHSEQYPSTDNAYVNSNLVNIAPKVGGYIMQIYVNNNQLVHTGDILVTINPQDYALMLDKAQQDLEIAKEQEDNAMQQISLSKVALNKAVSDYKFALEIDKRYSDLYQQNAGSLQDMQKYHNQLDVAKQALNQANINVTQATISYNAAKTHAEQAKIEIKNASNNNKYTIIKSPVNGYVSSLNLQIGELVAPGQKLFGIVDNTSWWVDANFKETQLKRIKVGQAAEIALDMYKHKYHGIVDSISYASGNIFSLLPAQNATGNWVKVTQRFTVRIKLDNNNDFPLRVGASSEVTIDTSNKIGNTIKPQNR